MSELDPELLVLLEKAKADHDPGSADQERVAASLCAFVGIPFATLAGSPEAGVDASPEAAQSSAPSATRAGSLSGGSGMSATAAKFVIGLAVAAIGVWSALPAREPSSQVAVQGARQAPPVRAVDALPALVPHSSADTDTHVASAKNVGQMSDASRPEARHSRPQTARVTAAPSGSRTRAATATDEPTRAPRIPRADEESEAAVGTQEVAPPPPTQSRSAHAEILLIRAALTSLNQHSPERALQLLQRHRVEYPQGIMSQERDGLWIIALCVGGRIEEGRRASQPFLHEVPYSPLSQRIRSACGEPSK